MIFNVNVNTLSSLIKGHLLVHELYNFLTYLKVVSINSAYRSWQSSIMLQLYE